MSEDSSPKFETKTTTYANAIEWKQEVIMRLFKCLDAFIIADAKIYTKEADPSIPAFISSVKSLYLICRDKVSYLPEKKQEPYSEMMEGFDNFFLTPFKETSIKVNYQKCCAGLVLMRSLLEELEYTKVERETVKVTPEMINKKVQKDRLRLMG